MPDPARGSQVSEPRVKPDTVALLKEHGDKRAASGILPYSQVSVWLSHHQNGLFPEVE